MIELECSPLGPSSYCKKVKAAWQLSNTRQVPTYLVRCIRMILG